MAFTKPTGDQIRFRSSQTGDHTLDTYLEAAEKGGRSIAALLDDIFDANGNVDAGFVTFQVDGTTNALQYAPGPQGAGGTFIDTNTFLFRLQGNWEQDRDYERLDLVTHENNLYISNSEHNSGSTGVFADTASNWQLVAAAETLLTAIDSKADELEASKSETYFHGFERSTDGELKWTTGPGPTTVSTYNGWQAADPRTSYPRMQRLPLVIKTRIDVPTNSQPINRDADSSGSWGPTSPTAVPSWWTGNVTSIANNPVYAGQIEVPYLPLNSRWSWVTKQYLMYNAGTSDRNVVFFMQSVDEPDFVMFLSQNSRGVDNTTSINAALCFSEGAGWTYAQSGRYTYNMYYDSANCMFITSPSQIPVGPNRKFNIYFTRQFSNYTADSGTLEIRGELFPLIWELCCEDLDYDLPYPSTYYINNPDKTISWDRGWDNWQQIDPSVPGDANKFRAYHQYDVPNLAQSSASTNSFSHQDVQHYTHAYDIQRLGGSDEQYFLDNDGHLKVKLGEHRYPRYEVSLQAKDANNDGVPEPVLALNETQQKTITLVRGHIYDFVYTTSMVDMTEPVPENRQTVQFRLSETQDGVHGTDSNGDAGTAYLTDVSLNSQGSVSRIKITADTPNTLFYYGAQISGIGGTINVVNEDANP